MKKFTLSLLVPTILFGIQLGSAYALTISETTYNGPEISHFAVGTMSTDKASYAAGETITISTSVTIDKDIGIQGAGGSGVFSAQQMAAGCGCGVEPYMGYINTGDILDDSMPFFVSDQYAYFPIPGATAPGTYDLDVRVAIFSKNSLGNTYSSDFSYTLLPYTVAAPSVTVDLCFSGPCP